MGRVPKALDGVPELAGFGVLGAEHVENDETTARSQQGPGRIENHARPEGRRSARARTRWTGPRAWPCPASSRWAPPSRAVTSAALNVGDDRKASACRANSAWTVSS